MVAFMAREHPEVRVVPVGTLPFSYEMTLRPLLTGGSITHFVNCASLGSNSESIADPLGYYATNSIGVLHQLEAIRKLSSHTRYVNLGTIYEGSADIGLAGPPYPSSKRVARDIIATYRQQYGLHASTATLGFTEYYGRHESFLSRRIAKGVAKIARAIRLDESFHPLCLDHLDDSHCWTWAEDVADGLWRTLNAESPGEMLLVNDEAHTVREFVKLAFAAVGLPGEWCLEWGFVSSKSDRYPLALTPPDTRELHRWSLASYSTRHGLDWQPQTTFPQLVERMVQYDIDLLDNPKPAPKWPA